METITEPQCITCGSHDGVNESLCPSCHAGEVTPGMLGYVTDNGDIVEGARRRRALRLFLYAAMTEADLGGAA